VKDEKDVWLLEARKGEIEEVEVYEHSAIDYMD